MKLEKALYQRSYLFFIAFVALVVAGFWFTYFTRLLDQKNYRMHLHGIALIVWCGMLVTQAFLIYSKNHALHRTIGKFSYAWVPVIVITTLDLLHYQLPKAQLGTMDFFFVALVINALGAFLILYGLAIYYRKQPAIHARFMVCSVFPMLTPATDRIIYIFFEPMVPYLYTIEGNSIAPVVGFAMADVILVALAIWDWRSHKRLYVFPLALAVLLGYHYSVLTFYQYDFWKTFSIWFAGW
jgi:hypothetical protein